MGKMMLAYVPDRSRPLLYPGSNVLRNKAGLTDAEALERFETVMTFARSEEPLPNGCLSVSHRTIHHHLFQDVYAWAGKFRTVRITKGACTFFYPENIAGEMRRAFAWLRESRGLHGMNGEDFAQNTAHFLAELNAIQGNGRTQLTFLALLADRADHPLDLDKLEPDTMLEVMVRSFNGDVVPLAAVVRYSSHRRPHSDHGFCVLQPA
jgi:cell filamentation protein